MCESLLKHLTPKQKPAPQTLDQTNIKGMRGVKSRNMKVKKWLVIMKLNTDGEHAHTHTCMCTRIFTRAPTHAHTHTHRLKHPEHSLCARLFLQGELVVLLSADIKEACMSV